LTCEHAEQSKYRCSYFSLEPFPIESKVIDQLNYHLLVEDHNLFQEISQASWSKPIEIRPNFILHKEKSTLQEVDLETLFDVVYFDAFAPSKQPEMWTIDLFTKVFQAMNMGGVLTTYSSAGFVKRNLKAAGFRLEHPAGPNGKREMTVAFKD
jgi:tRNA U34 5-methylaminomethyl-2-thiouridine-forming methyltransferase MnmC